MGDLVQSTREHVPTEDRRLLPKQEQEEEEEEKEGEEEIGEEQREGEEEIGEGEKKEEEIGEEQKEGEEEIGGGGKDEEDEVPENPREDEAGAQVSLISISEDPPAISIIPFEDFQKALGEHCAAAAVSSQLCAHRDVLVGKLESLLKIRKQSLYRIDELEVLKLRLKSKDLSLENARVSLQEKSEDIAIAKDKLLPAARSLLAAAKSLAGRYSNLQDARRHLEGEGGQYRLSYLQNMLSTRRRLMISQVAALYPIVPRSVHIAKKAEPNGTGPLQRHCTNTIPQSTDSSTSVEKGDSLPMTIGGLHVVAPLNNRPGVFVEPSDHESSATAFGYAAHCLSLLAACLDVPLRYPIRLGASRSYIRDYAPIVEAAEGAGNSIGPDSGGIRRSPTEFPLFTEGQDSTRSAYAVFLLNKDLEQVLNYMGAESVGASHTLPNLNKIIQLLCSGACKTC